MRHSKFARVGLAPLAAVLLAAPLVAQVKNYKDIKYPSLPEFKVTNPQVMTLDNGMTIFLMEDHELPLIDVIATVRTGSFWVPTDKVGLGGIFGQVQREGGTTSMSGNEIDDFLEARAASIETGMGGDRGSASMSCLKEDFDDIFALFSDVLRNPAFEQEKIDLAKVQNNTAISRRNDNAAGIVGREFRMLLYGKDSPLANQPEYATVAGITRDDLLAWHKEYYHPNNVLLGVVGDFDSDEMISKIKSTFGDWEKGPGFDEPFPTIDTADPGFYLIEKNDVTQAFVRVGHLGIERDNPDYFAVQVMNEVFGGGFAARLFSRVRSDQGLAYSVGGGVGSSFGYPGVFQLVMSTKSETMAAGVDALKKEIDLLIGDEPATADELKRAKEAILNSFVFNYASKRQILGQQMTYAYYGFPADYLETYRANIEKVTRDDVNRVAKKYMHPDKLITLVVGKPADFDRPASSFGEVVALDITIPPPPDTRKAVAKNAETLAEGSKLFARAAGLLAGSAGKVKAVQASYTLNLTLGGQAMSLGQEVAFELPSKMRQTIKTPMGEQVSVMNGTAGVAMGGGQTRPMSTEQVAENLEGLNRELLVLSNLGNSDDLEAVAAGEEQVDGVSCALVSVAYQETESQLCVDDDGRVLKQSYRGKHPMQGTPGTIEILFQEYDEIEGRQIPRKRVMTFEGQELATITLLEIQFNPELDPSLFEIPE